MPPLPGGVATATMESSVENNDRLPVTDCQLPTLSLLGRRDNHRLHKGVTDALGCRAGILGDREMHDPAFVGIERPHFLRNSGRPCLLRIEPRHLLQLHILVLAESVTVDDDTIIVAELPAERRGDQVPQRLQSFAAAADVPDVTATAAEGVTAEQACRQAIRRCDNPPRRRAARISPWTPSVGLSRSVAVCGAVGAASRRRYAVGCPSAAR